MTKPLNKKAYSSIPHLPESRLGSGDHYIHQGQANIATKQSRPGDLIIVQEKLDGSNVCAAKIYGHVVPLIRAGYLANSSRFKQHHMWDYWVNKNYLRFDELLQEGERICGEWLVQAHGTRYDLHHEPFVAFDILRDDTRELYDVFAERIGKFDFQRPALIHKGEAYPVKAALEQIQVSGHGALDPVEGAIWRVENKGRVEFLCKFVRHDKEDGKYFKEETWNVDPAKFYI